MNTLPQAIAGYIDAANAQAPARLAACFHADATVRGHFPGSPITLNFHVLLASSSIQSPEITP